jgi:hypothetical protein
MTGCAPRELAPEQSLSGQTSLLGCLQPGAGPAEFILTERDGATRVTLVGHPDLAEHAGGNHAVRVIGMLNRETNAEAMKVIRVEHLAASCKTPF